MDGATETTSTNPLVLHLFGTSVTFGMIACFTSNGLGHCPT